MPLYLGVPAYKINDELRDLNAEASMTPSCWVLLEGFAGGNIVRIGDVHRLL